MQPVPHSTTDRPDALPLAQLRRGEVATVCSAELDAHDGALLRAMGLRPEARVRVCRLGQPCIVEVCDDCGGGCRIGLARDIAERVLVAPAIRPAG